MEQYTVDQRVHIVKTYYGNSCSVKNTFRKLRDFFGAHNRPTEKTIRSIVQKFEVTGSVKNLPTPVRARSKRSVENIAAVRESVAANPKLSIPRRSQQLGIAQTTTWRILRKDLALKAYKIQLTQELKPADHRQRRIFVDWVLQNKAVNNDFSKRIIFSDEAHFHLDGYVNRQNCRIWGHENPREIHEKAMHPQRVTVWCGLWAGGVIGPYFFEDENGQGVTVNGDRYRAMINNFLWPEITDMNLNDMWFQQDGATCHTANETMNLLASKFRGRILSRNGDANWPPRSCDLTPLDYFLWGYVKSKVYANNPQTIHDLKENIRRTIHEIEPQLCSDVIENFDKRIFSCQRSRGGHLADMIFHV